MIGGYRDTASCFENDALIVSSDALLLEQLVFSLMDELLVSISREPFFCEPCVEDDDEVDESFE